MKANQYGHILANPAAQINTTAGGNINLKPEKADTYTVGFVLQPLALQGFSMSLDYYDIKIDDTIASLTSNTVLTNCANTGDPQLCGLIHRDPSTGSLWFNNNDYVDTDEVNIGTITTKGYDLAARYAMDMGSVGKLSFTLSGTYVTDWSTQPLPTGGSYDCTGLYGSTCDAPTPKWRHVLETDWATPVGRPDLAAALALHRAGGRGRLELQSAAHTAPTSRASATSVATTTSTCRVRSPGDAHLTLPCRCQQHHRQVAADRPERQPVELPEHHLQRQHLGGHVRHAGPLPVLARVSEVLNEAPRFVETNCGGLRPAAFF